MKVVDINKLDSLTDAIIRNDVVHGSLRPWGRLRRAKRSEKEKSNVLISGWKKHM